VTSGSLSFASKCKSPSVEDILGDKFTVYVPNSTDITYFKGETSISMEVMKQQYDVGILVDIAPDGDMGRVIHNLITNIFYAGSQKFSAPKMKEQHLLLPWLKLALTTKDR